MSTPASAVTREIQCRAEHYLRQNCLTVDYYRIRRRLAYPLPIKSLHIPAVPVEGIANYPWATWMLWELEERISALGWAAQLLQNEEAGSAAAIDLWHLAQWPRYRQYDTLDLSLGHAARILANAHRQWTWIEDDLRIAIAAALQRIVEDAEPLLEKSLGEYSCADDILALPEPHAVLQNIRLIGPTGVAMAATAVNATQHDTFNRALQNAVTALLELRERGFSEGVAYDGYVLDFLLDWLQLLPDGQQNFLLDHPQFARYLDASLFQSTPGDLAQVAEIGDVESAQMPFHISAQAKSQKLRLNETCAWYLRQCRPDALRTDALAALHLPGAQMQTEVATPEAEATNAHNTLVLRSGWENQDVAVVMAASNSPMGHIHCNNGTLAMGSNKSWFIGPPGYQQYLPNSEREFTLGTASRNTPVINGFSPASKAMQISLLESNDIAQATEIELTHCYPKELSLSSVRRRVQLIEKQLVVVEDTINGDSVQNISYYWHGHPEAAWWIEDNWACLRQGGSTLWFGSPQMELSECGLQRLRGSRGQLTLATRTPFEGTAAALVRWYFLFSEIHPNQNELFHRCERA
jgi:hypothetical protein